MKTKANDRELTFKEFVNEYCAKKGYILLDFGYLDDCICNIPIKAKYFKVRECKKHTILTITGENKWETIKYKTIIRKNHLIFI